MIALLQQIGYKYIILPTNKEDFDRIQLHKNSCKKDIHCVSQNWSVTLSALDTALYNINII